MALKSVACPRKSASNRRSDVGQVSTYVKSTVPGDDLNESCVMGSASIYIKSL